MSLLLAENGEAEERYGRVEAVADLGVAGGPVIVPLTVIDAAIADRRNQPLGLQVANNVPVEAIEPYLRTVDLIAIEFPGFSDGRGFSLARRLRRAGFEGTLRAVGPLIADQYAEAIGCGFTEIELPDEMAARQPLEQWMKAKDIVTARYQNGYRTGESILQKRLAARKA